MSRAIRARAAGRPGPGAVRSFAAPTGDQPGWPPVSSGRAARLRAEWHRRSVQGSWTSANDWWDPACDALVEALVAGRDARPAVRRLGRSRAHLGVPIEEAMDDVLVLWDVRDRSEPPVRVLRALAGGWAEAGLEPAGAASCFDAITGLCTRAHLEARLGELYRAGELGGPEGGHRLVVLDVGWLPGPVADEAAWRQVDGVYRCAEALRRVFNGGEPLARLAPARLGALARTGPGLSEQLARLDALLTATGGEDLVPAVWVESLPGTFGLVPQLLADLAR